MEFLLKRRNLALEHSARIECSSAKFRRFKRNSMSPKNSKSLRSYRWYGPDDLRSFAHRSRAASMGCSQADYSGKPVAIINTWSEIKLCHGHLRECANDVKCGVWQASGFPVETPAITLRRAKDLARIRTCVCAKCGSAARNFPPPSLRAGASQDQDASYKNRSWSHPNPAGGRNPAIFQTPTRDVLDFLGAPSPTVFARTNAGTLRRSVCTPELARQRPHCRGTATHLQERSIRNRRPPRAGPAWRILPARSLPAPANSPTRTRSY